jgi:hypothetical protein
MPVAATVQVQPAVDVISDLDGALITTWAITPPLVVVGTGAGLSGPLEVAAGLVLDTGTIINKRRFRGRSFLNPLVATAQNAPTPPAGTITNVAAFGVALITATPPAAIAPCMVWKRPKGLTPGLSRSVLTATISPKWWVIRSRRD